MLSCKAGQKCSAVCKEIIIEQKEKQCSGVVDFPEANQLLKCMPEAVPSLNMCAHDAQEYYFLFANN